jgi:hypothetical protein
MDKKATRIVKAHMDNNGVIIFCLLQRQMERLHVVHTFGYGTCHKIWLRIHGLGTDTVTMKVEAASFVKEQIGKWGK